MSVAHAVCVGGGGGGGRGKLGFASCSGLCVGGGGGGGCPACRSLSTISYSHMLGMDQV